MKQVQFEYQGDLDRKAFISFVYNKHGLFQPVKILGRWYCSERYVTRLHEAGRPKAKYWMGYNPANPSWYFPEGRSVATAHPREGFRCFLSAPVDWTQADQDLLTELESQPKVSVVVRRPGQFPQGIPVVGNEKFVITPGHDWVSVTSAFGIRTLFTAEYYDRLKKAGLAPDGMATGLSSKITVNNHCVMFGAQHGAGLVWVFSEWTLESHQRLVDYESKPKIVGVTISRTSCPEFEAGYAAGTILKPDEGEAWVSVKTAAFGRTIFTKAYGERIQKAWPSTIMYICDASKGIEIREGGHLSVLGAFMETGYFSTSYWSQEDHLKLLAAEVQVVSG